MSTAKALEGGLDQALATAQDAARREPAAARHRVFLFQLYAIGGAWERALRQLNVLSDLDPKLELLVSAYRQLIACEGVRAEVFAGKRAPLCLGHPPAWFGHLLEALRLDAEGRHDAAKDLRDDAFAQAEATVGAIAGLPFAWIADADERLGPVLEAVVNGRYFWIPFARIRRIETDAVEDLRDLVWLPARFTWANDGTAVGFIPARYPGSEAADEEALRLARRTEWQQQGAGSFKGLGQRMLATDTGEHALLELRLVTLEPPPMEAAEGGPAEGDDG